MGMLGVAEMKKLAEWEICMLKGSLEVAQMFEVIMGLPSGHPVQSDMIQNVLSSLTS